MKMHVCLCRCRVLLFLSLMYQYQLPIPSAKQALKSQFRFCYKKCEWLMYMHSISKASTYMIYLPLKVHANNIHKLILRADVYCVHTGSMYMYTV